MMEIVRSQDTFVGTAEYARGDSWEPDQAFTPADFLRKWQGYCGDIFSEDRIAEILSIVDNLENEPDVSGLVEKLIGASPLPARTMVTP